MNDVETLLKKSEQEGKYTYAMRTYHYWPPWKEKSRDEACDGRTDIYCSKIF